MVPIVSCNRKCRTLLVEDNADFRRVVKQTLCERFPCMVVVEAADGEDALRKIGNSLVPPATDGESKPDHLPYSMKTWGKTVIEE